MEQCKEHKWKHVKNFKANEGYLCKCCNTFVADPKANIATERSSADAPCCAESLGEFYAYLSGLTIKKMLDHIHSQALGRNDHIAEAVIAEAMGKL